MKPFYEHGGITIYHGDCRSGLCDQNLQERVEPETVLITDPPYQHMHGGLLTAFAGGKAVAGRRQATTTVGLNGLNLGQIQHAEWLPLACALVVGGVVFCSYHDVAEVRGSFTEAEIVKGLMVWHKPNAMPVMRNVPRHAVEFAWMFASRDATPLKWSGIETLYSIPFPNAGCVSSGERVTDTTGKSAHPSQKPLRLMHHLLAIGGDCILDPFMGTGTTLRAAKDLGRRAIGIEIEERYCEIAARRLEQEVLDLDGVA